MKISDVLAFNKERYFNGAIQAEWFYDQELSEEISTSYVFHGPKYYGVKNKDVDAKQHTLMDTVSFVNMLAGATKRAVSNGFIMTIAGYGTGKSHLAVTLGELLSGHNPITRRTIIDNIASIESKMAEDLTETLGHGKNIVLVLNGMNNFNLDYEVMKCARKALAQHGIDESVLKEVTKAYSVAEHFLLSTYDMLSERYMYHARKLGFMDLDRSSLLETLKSQLQHNKNAFSIIDSVYKEINGQNIQWESGISAGEVISFLCKRFIEEKHIFDRVFILFDEFGRYIEYAAQNPGVAGDSALQQIFEAVQNSHGKAIHVAFIQSELSAYLSRIPNTSNISRYVGRYDTSEKYYLSSNFETILANLIQKKDDSAFHSLIVGPVNRQRNHYLMMKSAINRWAKASSEKSVWADDEMFLNVICKGCYPLHPITTWMLSSMSGWMQQRSTISFTEEMFKNMGERYLSSTSVFLPCISPSDIVESRVLNEMINSEEKGLVQSQYCLLYRDAIAKIGDSLTQEDRKVLNAILIINVGRFECYDQEDCILAIRHCSCLKEETVRGSLRQLESAQGIITFNQQTKRYDILAETNGRNEYKRIFLRHKILQYNRVGIDQADELISKAWGMDRAVETAFGRLHDISSIEWRYDRRLIALDDFEKFARTYSNEIDAAIDGEKARGLLVLLYTTSTVNEAAPRAIDVYHKFEYRKKPIIVVLLSDSEKTLIDCLEGHRALMSFTASEQSRFERFIKEDERANLAMVAMAFERMLRKRLIVYDTGIESSSTRLNQLCLQKFEDCYSSPVPFMFDGFEKKLTPAVKKYVSDVAVNIANGTICQPGSFDMLQRDLQNRIKGLFSDDVQRSWKMLSSTHKLHLPDHEVLSKIFTDARKELDAPGLHTIQAVFTKYVRAPYGMNQYSLSIMVMAFLGLYSGGLVIHDGDGHKIDLPQMVQLIFMDRKGLQYQKLLHLNVTAVSEGSNDAVRDICERIRVNRHVEECQTLSNQLEQLLDTCTISSELEGDIVSARLRIKDGKRLYKEIYRNIETAQKEIGDKKLNVLKCANILNLIARYSGEIEADSGYFYSSTYEKMREECFRKINEWIEEYGPKRVSEFTCELQDLSLIKLKVSSVCKIYAVNGFRDLAVMFHKRIEDLEKHLLLEQRYSAPVEKCKLFITTEKISSTSKREECAHVRQKAKEWIEFWENASDFVSIQREKFISSLKTMADNAKKRIEENEESFDKLLILVQTMTNESAFERIKKIADKLNDFGLPEEEHEALKNIQEEMLEFEQYWETIKVSRTNFASVQYEALDKFKKAPYYELTRVHLGKLDAQIKKEAKAWLSDHLPKVKLLKKMEVSVALEMKKRLDVAPNCLDDDDLQQVEEAKAALLERIKEGRIEAIEELFMGLSTEEKEKCIVVLQGKMSKDIPAPQTGMGNLRFYDEELELLMYVYCKFKSEWFTPRSVRIVALSRLLKNLPIYALEDRNKDRFRNVAGIDLQIRTLAQCDPYCPHQQSLKPSADMQRIWNTYFNREKDLQEQVEKVLKYYSIDKEKYPELF